MIFAFLKRTFFYVVLAWLSCGALAWADPILMLSPEEQAAIDSSYAQEAQLNKALETETNQAKITKMRTTLATIQQARTELARLYATDMGNPAYRYSPHKLLKDYRTTLVAELAKFKPTAATAATAPADFDPTAMNAALKNLQADHADDVQRQAKELQMIAGTVEIDPPDDAPLTAKKAEFAKLQKDIEDARNLFVGKEDADGNEIIHATGNERPFIRAQEALRAFMKENGALQTFSALESSPALEDAKAEAGLQNTVASAMRDKIASLEEKLARAESARIPDDAKIQALKDQLSEFHSRLDIVKADLERSQKRIATEQQKVDAFVANQRKLQKAAVDAAQERAQSNLAAARTAARAVDVRTRAFDAATGTGGVSMKNLIDAKEKLIKDQRDKYVADIAATPLAATLTDPRTTPAARQAALDAEVRSFEDQFDDKIDEQGVVIRKGTKLVREGSLSALDRQLTELDGQIEDARKKFEDDFAKRNPMAADETVALYEARLATQREQEFQTTPEFGALMVKKGALSATRDNLRQQRDAMVQLVQVEKDAALFAEQNDAYKRITAAATTAAGLSPQDAQAQRDLYRELLTEKRVRDQMEAKAKKDAEAAAPIRAMEQAVADLADPTQTKAYEKLLPKEKAKVLEALKDSATYADHDLETTHRFSKPAADLVKAVRAKLRNGGRRSATTTFNAFITALEGAPVKISPTARAAWAKGPLYAKIRTDVDATTNAAIDDARQKAAVQDIQLQKAAAASGRSFMSVQIARDRDLDELNNYKVNLARILGIAPTHTNLDGSPSGNYSIENDLARVADEDAKQVRVLARADDYFAAIKDTLDQIQSNFDQELRKLSDEPESAERNAAIADLKKRAAQTVVAFQTDPVAYLMQTKSDPENLTAKGEASEQLDALRRNLEKRGISFWREETAQSDIVNALNLLRNPKEATKDNPGGVSTVVLAAADQARRIAGKSTAIVSLSDYIATPEVTKLFRKKIVDTILDGQEPSVTRADGSVVAVSDYLGTADELKKRAKDLKILAASPEDFAARTQARLDSAAASVAPEINTVKRFVVLMKQNEDGSVTPVELPSAVPEFRGQKVCLQSEQDAEEYAAAHHEASLTAVTVDLDLSNLSPDELRAGISQALGKVYTKPGAADAITKDILPTDNDETLAAELGTLTAARNQIIEMDQTSKQASSELSALRVHSDLTAIKLAEDPADDVSPSDDEDTQMKKMVRRFDEEKKTYQELLNKYGITFKKGVPVYPEDLSAEKRDKFEATRSYYHEYLAGVINHADAHTAYSTPDAEDPESEPYSKTNRTLLFGLAQDALDELSRPGLRELNPDGFDPIGKKELLTEQHVEAEREFTSDAHALQEMLAANPSAAHLQPEVEAAKAKWLEYSKSKHYGADSAVTRMAETEFRKLQAKMRAKLELDPAERIAALEDEIKKYKSRAKNLIDPAAASEAQAKYEELRKVFQAEHDLHKEQKRADVEGMTLEELRRQRAAQEDAEKASARTARLATELSGMGRITARSGITASEAHRVAEELTTPRKQTAAVIPAGKRIGSRDVVTKAPRATRARRLASHLTAGAA